MVLAWLCFFFFLVAFVRSPVFITSYLIDHISTFQNRGLVFTHGLVAMVLDFVEFRFYKKH